jgi:hypothetical protein
MFVSALALLLLLLLLLLPFCLSVDKKRYNYENKVYKAVVQGICSHSRPPSGSLFTAKRDCAGLTGEVEAERPYGLGTMVTLSKAAISSISNLISKRL